MIEECRVCGDKKFTKVLETKPLPEYVWPTGKVNATELSPCCVYQCSSCYHLQLQKFSNEDVGKFYRHGSHVEENMPAKKQRLQKILNDLGEDFFINKKILDVGGGSNPFVNLLNDYSKHVFVSDFEIPDETVRFCGGNVYRGMFESADIPLGSFDVILSFHSLEHMNNPALVVGKMRKLLKKDGYVIVEVPNMVNVVKEIPYFSIFHQHINMFTKNSLVNLFCRQGFKLKSVLQESLAMLMVFSVSEDKKNFDNVSVSAYLIDEFDSKMKYLDDQLIKLYQKFNPKKLGVYGAGGSTTLLLHHVLSLKDNVKFCFDRDLLKQGKYIPGTAIKIRKPEDLKKCDFVVFLTDEIKSLYSSQLAVPNFSVAEILRNHEI